MDHVDEAAEAGRIDRRELVAAEQPLRVVPFLVDLDQLDAVRRGAVQLLLVPLVRVPRLAARILAQVVAALAGQVAR